MRSFEFVYFTNFISCLFFCMVFFVLVGQITVRKLRKKEETKHVLGLEFASGLDILNVAASLSRPKFMTKKLEKGSFPGLYAKSEILRQHTTRLDRYLATLFYWLLSGTGSLLICLMLLDKFGVWD
jgi:hypothetical protein